MLLVWGRYVSLLLILLVVSTFVPKQAHADDRLNYLVKILQTSSTFRVRAQAAISLGRLDSSGRAVKALSKALKDKHPAVRLAAAASLERLGDPSALAALNRATKDGDRSVRKQARRAIAQLERVIREQKRYAKPKVTKGAGRYYVSVAMPGAAAKKVNQAMLKEIRGYLVQGVGGLDGVVMAPSKESRKSAIRVLKKQDLIGYAIDASVVRLEDKEGGVRAVVSVILGTYPGRDIRAMLQGAATVPGVKGREAQMMAIQGAFQSALRRMPQAMLASEATSYHVRR